MSLAAFSAFLLAAVALAITPGPGIAYVVARTVAGGRAVGLASCVGTALGGLLHVAAAALGLSLLIAQSATLFALLKYVGAAYLLYLGLRLLLQKPRAVGDMAAQSLAGQGAAPPHAGNPADARRAFFEGIAVEAFNVKTALFFLAFLPQFVSPAASVAGQMALMGSVCVLLNTLADVAAVLLAQRLLQAGRSAGARAVRERWLSRASGLTMLGLGAFLALTRRQS